MSDDRIYCEKCNQPIERGEKYISLTVTVEQEQGAGITVHNAVGLIARHVRCGVADIYEKLEIEWTTPDELIHVPHPIKN